jgi:uncharacterized membrane protein (DUF2068 family)
MNRKTSTRIASVFLCLHGLIEVSALFALQMMSDSLVGFGGMDKSQIEANIGSIATLGILWGLIRIIAAVGSWSLKKWGMALGIAMSLVTLAAAVTVIPAGVADTLLAGLALIFMLYAWFGNQTVQME